MPQAQKRYRKTAILTNQGLQKLEASKLKAKFSNSCTQAYTLETLSEYTGLSPHTLSKIHVCKAGVDLRTLTRYFSAFNLTLEPGDYRQPLYSKSLESDQPTIKENAQLFYPDKLYKTRVIAESPHIETIVNLGMAPDVSKFCGRTTELAILQKWILEERSRLIALVGMGGIGKSALAAKVSQLLQADFEFVIWRSLRNAPPLETLLAELVSFLSQQQNIQAKPEQLLYWLQTHRCLVILDHQDTLLQPGQLAGNYQPNFCNYGELFQLLAEASHQSCILLTSREKSTEVGIFEDGNGAVRSLFLQGSWEASLALMDAKGLVGNEAQKRHLCELYRSNPLVLKMVATSIQSLFDGEITTFLQTETLILNGIRRLLNQQFERLSSLEQTIMYWLAINREWTTIAQLQADIVPTVSRANLLESLESLTWRSFIEKRSGAYSQQPAIMEYVTDCLIHKLATELLIIQTSSLNHYALVKTTVLDCIRETQIRLILHPFIEQLQAAFHHSSEQLEHHLQSILSALRCAPESVFGYGVGNFINLCLYLQIDLTSYDFSRLKIRHADFQGKTLQHINFQCANFL
ncbi:MULTISPECIES: NB-ARC domain-containing protein [unclassified Calothrix]|uniref:NB-ARC domain-containing protein n=1 Tax=unclassified Calothrix TaxID=2619626 RepID=UPI001F54DA0D|nr:MULTISPECIES: NB-ARC domain-containing protein [unclassified Calothrix]